VDCGLISDQVNFFGVSLVKGPEEGIRSQWQANFIQVFPLNLSKLPFEHEDI